MSIIRGKRPDSKFYTLDKSISEDARLSWAARGLLIFLLGKPDHWEVSVAHLIKQTASAIGKASGRDAVRQLLKELEAAGYLTAAKARAKGGVFSGVDYIVSETPNPPETENPAPVEPAAAEPSPVNPLQVNNDLEQLTDYSVSNQLWDSCESAPADGFDLVDGAATGSKKQKRVKQSKASQSAAMPADFTPTAQHVELAKSLRLDLQSEFEQFRDFHAAKGSKFKDWHAALRTWLRNAPNFNRPASAGNGRAGYLNQAAPKDYHKGVGPDGSF